MHLYQVTFEKSSGNMVGSPLKLPMENPTRIYPDSLGSERPNLTIIPPGIPFVPDDKTIDAATNKNLFRPHNMTGTTSPLQFPRFCRSVSDQENKNCQGVQEVTEAV